MFDIAWSEFLVVAVVALVVVGPKDLPALLRTVGKTVASLRRMAGEFQGQFNEAMREAELDGLKDELTGMKDKASRMVGSSPFQIARDEIKNALTDSPKTPSALAGAQDKAASDAPSALAPAPQIDPIPEPPAPTAAEFKPVGAPAMRPVEPDPQPKKAASRAKKTAAAGEKPAPKKAAAADKTETAKAAPKIPRKKPAKSKASKDESEPTPPGASA